MAARPYDDPENRVRMVAHVRHISPGTTEEHSYWFYIGNANVEFSSRPLVDERYAGQPQPYGTTYPAELTLTVVGIAEADETRQLETVLGECEGWRMEAMCYAVTAYQQGHVEHAMEVSHLALTAPRDDGDPRLKLARDRLHVLMARGRAPHPSDTTQRRD